MELDECLKSKVRFHLGYNSGAQMPAGDRARLEEAMSLVPDELWYNELVYHVKRCDIAWTASAYFPDDLNDPDGQGVVNFSRQEVISGDVQRTISQSDPLKGDEYFREIYLENVTAWLRVCMLPTIVVLKYGVMPLIGRAVNLLWLCLVLLILPLAAELR